MVNTICQCKWLVRGCYRTHSCKRIDWRRRSESSLKVLLCTRWRRILSSCMCSHFLSSTFEELSLRLIVFRVQYEVIEILRLEGLEIGFNSFKEIVCLKEIINIDGRKGGPSSTTSSCGQQCPYLFAHCANLCCKSLIFVCTNLKQ